MLVLSRKKDESIFMEVGGIRIRILVADLRLGRKSRPDGQVRLALEAPPEVAVWREELKKLQPTQTTPQQIQNLQKKIETEPAEVYQAKASEYLTSHQLADFRHCPLLYYKKKLGLIEEEDRPAFLVGRALHTLVLEGQDAFKEQYAVGGPVNPKTGELYGANTKAFAEWAAEQGKPVLTVQQYDLVERMAEGIRSHGLARDLLSEGVPEGVVRAEYCQIPCQIRMDWFDSHRGIVDLKTCDDLTWFEADARRYEYIHQVAFYQAVLSQVIGLFVPIHFIAVEKKEPYRCGVWKIHDDALAQARRENEEAIERLRRCMAADTWPSGYEECRVFDYV